MLIGVGLLSAAFRYAMNLYSSIACETMVKTSRDLLYHQIERLPWSWHMKNATGDIIQRCTADVERIKTFFQEQFVSVFRIIVLIVLSLACMVAMNCAAFDHRACHVPNHHFIFAFVPQQNP